MPIESMPPDSIPRAKRRRLAALAAAGTLSAALVPALMLAPAPAAATMPCVPASYTANASADLLKLTLLDVGPLGLVPAPLANVTIGHATADMAHAQPRHATGAADYLSATLAGLTVPPSLLNTHARQDAPPSHLTPDKHSLVAFNSGLLKLGVGNVSASAGRSGPYSCSLASADASVADAAVLPGLGGLSLLSLPQNLNGNAGAGLINQNGHIASAAGADAGLAELNLFAGTAAEIGIKVITEPTLRGIATGTLATSKVTYTSPVLEVVLPGGGQMTLDGVHTHLDVVTPASAGVVSGLLGSLPLAQSLPVLGKRTQIELRLTIGELTKHITGTSVSGEAATLRLQLLLPPAGTPSGIAAHAAAGATTLLDLGLGELSVAATAPAAATPPAPGGGGYGSPPPCPNSGGYGYGGTTTCPSPSPSPSTSTVPVTGRSASPTAPSSVHATSTTPASLPITGSKTTWVLGSGVMLLVIGRLLMVLARRRMTE